MDINSIATIISMLGFPICMCGALCFYIYKVQTKLQEIITENTKMLEKLVDRVDKMVKSLYNQK